MIVVVFALVAALFYLWNDWTLNLLALLPFFPTLLFLRCRFIFVVAQQ